MSEEVNEYYNDVFANILVHFPVLIHLDISMYVLNKAIIQ